jgi:hypothetical protein
MLSSKKINENKGLVLPACRASFRNLGPFTRGCLAKSEASQKSSIVVKCIYKVFWPGIVLRT